MIALHAHVESLLSNQNMSDTNGKCAGGRKVQKKATKICKSNGNNRPEDKPAWMTTPPNDDEKEFELVEGKEYHRCPVHEGWTRHKPSEAKAFFLASPARAQAKDLDKFLDSKLMMKLSSKSLDANIPSDDEWRTCPMDCEFIRPMTAPNWLRRTPLAAAYCLSRFQSVSSHGCATSPNFWGVNQQRPAGCQGVMGSTQPSKRVRWNRQYWKEYLTLHAQMDRIRSKMIHTAAPFCMI